MLPPVSDAPIDAVSAMSLLGFGGLAVRRRRV
jgi:MYXO-CTERM domain-containing protein